MCGTSVKCGEEAPTLRSEAEAISDEHIRERAYDIWERHHRPEGFEMQFWLMAKRELIAERETKIVCAALSDRGVGE
ncbi:hypothetical protein PMNALOAF_1272 [Methylobacterium adhaesivum]|nr:hypothetical protein PMNALOAF_1272 [Methylobacterium adhaesivum]